jgi:hypothetical protein
MAILLEVLLSHRVNKNNPEENRGTDASGRLIPLLLTKLSAVGVVSTLLALPPCVVDPEVLCGAC